MPIYEFECQVCRKVFEELCFSSNLKGIICPQCGSQKLQRLFSTFGFTSSGERTQGSSLNSGCSTCSTRQCKTCR